MKLPPKHIMERVQPLIFFVVASVGLSVGLIQYCSENNAVRVRESMKLYNSFIGLNPDKKSLKQVQEKLIGLNTQRAAMIDKLRCELILELDKKEKISVKIGDELSCDGDNFRDITDFVDLDSHQQKLLRKRITEFLSKPETLHTGGTN